MMELTLRTATPAEQLYTREQSVQIDGQIGCIGHLRADLSIDGQGFFKRWQSHQKNLDTEDFQQEFESVLNALVNDEQYGGFLKNRDAMTDFCRGHRESSFNDGYAFGFRADTEQYSYLIRLNPFRGENNLFIYCCRRDRLDHHLKQAEKGICFIGPDHKEKFKIPDGEIVRIITSDYDVRDWIARYIDDCHVEIGGDFYHIGEFAEQLECSGGKVIPMRSTLPWKCCSVTSSADEIVVITKGEMGHRPAGIHPEGMTAREGATAANERIGVTKAQEAAMLYGSIYGWDKPAADPDYYNEQGEPIKFKHRDRGDAR